jgi:hypothetical protein
MRIILGRLLIACLSVGLGAALAQAAPAKAKHASASPKVSPEPAESTVPAEASEPEDASRFEVGAAIDTDSRRGLAQYGSITFSPFGLLEQSGVRLKLESVNASYYYNEEGNPEFFQPPKVLVHGHYIGASFLVGYEHVTDMLTLAGFVGADYQRNTLRRPLDLTPLQNLLDPESIDLTSGTNNNNPTIGTKWGVKFAVEADFKPIDEVSIVVTGNYSTANHSWWSRLRPGYAIAEDVYVGPEAGYQGNDFYRQWRVGGHVRGIKVGLVEMGASMGFLRDNTISNGLYGTFDASLRF